MYTFLMDISAQEGDQKPWSSRLPQTMWPYLQSELNTALSVVESIVPKVELVFMAALRNQF